VITYPAITFDRRLASEARGPVRRKQLDENYVSEPSLLRTDTDLSARLTAWLSFAADGD
jgi:hypothetical protein